MHACLTWLHANTGTWNAHCVFHHLCSLCTPRTWRYRRKCVVWWSFVACLSSLGPVLHRQCIVPSLYLVVSWDPLGLVFSVGLLPHPNYMCSLVECHISRIAHGLLTYTTSALCYQNNASKTGTPNKSQ